jgi:TatD DNase family protein
MLIDTHCHLDAAEFDTDRDAVYAAAIAAGVGRIVIPSVTANGLNEVKNTLVRYPACRAAYGIHPLYVAQGRESDISHLQRWLATETPLAVGEIGLDHFVKNIDPVRQEWFFVEQIKLAITFDLPLILHVRGAIDAILKQLRRYKPRGGIAHAFNGSRQQADEFIKLGFKLGFGGTITYSGSTRIRELATTLPIEAIVLETDAPDMPPAWRKGGRNSPAELPEIARILAELRQQSLAEISAATCRNAIAALPGLKESA